MLFLVVGDELQTRENAESDPGAAKSAGENLDRDCL